jgi:hypothetical protein
MQSIYGMVVRMHFLILASGFLTINGALGHGLYSSLAPLLLLTLSYYPGISGFHFRMPWQSA